MAGARVGEKDVARAFEAPDGVALPIVEIIVEPHAGRREVLQQHALDVPVVEKILGHVELETWRLRMHDAAARVHAIDLLADAHGFGCSLGFVRWHNGGTFRFWKRCLLSAGPYRSHGSTQVHWKTGRRQVESSESLDPLYHGNLGLTRSREIKLRGGNSAGVVEPF